MTLGRALVIGAGVGGLAAAIALRNAGFDPLVLERGPEVRGSGAGLMLGANSVAALHSLGLHETASGLGVPTTAGLLRNPSGSTLADLRLPPESERLGGDSMAVSRADLVSALAARAGNVVRTGCRVAGLRRTDGGVAARLEGGGEEHGRILVGADGLHSAMRARLHGSRPPRYAGYTAWRGVARPGAGVLSRVPRGAGLETWGRGVRFGCVYIGGGRVYWFATQNAPEGARDIPGESRRRALGLLRGWHEPVEALVRATPEEEIHRDDIYDRTPIRLHWGSGPVTLLGDAAHPMTPNLGQGAGQALVDAAALGEALSGPRAGEDLKDPEAGLRLYERRRALPTAALVLLSRYVGVAGQLESLTLTRLRDRAFRVAPRRVEECQLRMMLGYRGR